MNEEKKPLPLVLKDLSFADLIALRDHIQYMNTNGIDEQGVPKIDKISLSYRENKAEVEYLDAYIIGKYKKVKADSMPKKP